MVPSVDQACNANLLLKCWSSPILLPQEGRCVNETVFLAKQ